MGIVWEVMCAAIYAAKTKYVCGMFFRRNTDVCFFCMQQPSCSKVQTCDWKSIWLTFLSLSSSFLSHYLFSQRHFGWDLWRIWRWRGISGHCQPGSGWDWHWDLREGKKFRNHISPTYLNFIDITIVYNAQVEKTILTFYHLVSDLTAHFQM